VRLRDIKDAIVAIHSHLSRTPDLAREIAGEARRTVRTLEGALDAELFASWPVSIARFTTSSAGWREWRRQGLPLAAPPGAARAA
jgi:hypothetical protein